MKNNGAFRLKALALFCFVHLFAIDPNMRSQFRFDGN